MSAPTIELPGIDELVARAGMPLGTWWHNCHNVSHALVRAGIWPGARVARGWAKGVTGQHSWVILDADPYDPDTRIVDPTLWTYDMLTPGVVATTVDAGSHRAHGHGPHIMQAGRPDAPTGDTIELSRRGRACLSNGSLGGKFWMDMFGRLDRRGWSTVLNGTMVGWAAAEIVEAAWWTPELRHIVPVDLVGMLTDVNPMGVYLPGGERK